MKRTIEIVLAIIGTAIYVFFGSSGASMISIQGDSERTEALYNEMLAMEPGAENLPSYEVFVETLGTGGLLILIMSFLSVVAGIIAIVLLKKKNRSKAAGIIFLATGIISALFQFGLAIFASGFYVIAGMLCLWRKPKEDFA